MGGRRGGHGGGGEGGGGGADLVQGEGRGGGEASVGGDLRPVPVLQVAVILLRDVAGVNCTKYSKCLQGVAAKSEIRVWNIELSI